MMVTGALGAANDAATAVARVVAIQEIEYLRRQYARATDLIGQNTKASVAEGRAIYERIFTPDVAIRVTGGDIPAEDTVGPEGWVDVVIDALGEDYQDTQHLIGTQLVDIASLEVDESGAVSAGAATMSSYLQAWHATADNTVWLFLGIYHDQVRFTPGVGWQIYDMTLERVSAERRPMGEAD